MKTHTPIKLPPSPTREEVQEILALGRMPWAEFLKHSESFSVLHLNRLCALTVVQPGTRTTLREVHAFCQRILAHQMAEMLKPMPIFG